jgi:hypothetical protein
MTKIGTGNVKLPRVGQVGAVDDEETIQVRYIVPFAHTVECIRHHNDPSSSTTSRKMMVTYTNNGRI